jgi:hypothetical protein
MEETVRALLDKARERLEKYQRERRTKEYSDFYELALEACADAIGELQNMGISNKKLKAYKAAIDERGTCRTRAETIIKRVEALLAK